jgi:DNA-binding transcriptional LysR family regulator
MRYRRLDLNLLVALDALLNEKSVTRAASRLNMTQPAMSGALARLREYFGDALVVQVGRHMELTPLANSLVTPVHEIMLRIDAAIAIEPEFIAARSQRHFSFTASDYVIRIFLLELLQRIRRTAPGITFEFRQSSSRVQDELESGDVDFVIGPEVDVLPEHPHEPLFQDTYTVIAWKDNTSVSDTLTFDDYMGLGHVVFGHLQRGTPWLERWFAQHYGDARRLEVIAHNFMLLPYLVIGTDRIATIQTRLAQLYAQTLPLKLIRAPLELPLLTEVLQWNVHRDLDPASRWLRDEMKAHALSLSPTLTAPTPV